MQPLNATDLVACSPQCVALSLEFCESSRRLVALLPRVLNTLFQLRQLQQVAVRHAQLPLKHFRFRRLLVQRLAHLLQLAVAFAQLRVLARQPARDDVMLGAFGQIDCFVIVRRVGGCSFRSVLTSSLKTPTV